MKKHVIFGLVATALMSSSAFAVKEGGGGDALVAQFVATANALLQKPIWTAEQKKLLSNALNTSKIASVSILIDPATGNPIPDQNQLVAYGSPGKIQLKNSSSSRSGDASFEELIQDRRPIAQYVAHELYRASGALNSKGVSIDDSFQITIGQLHLDTLGTMPDLSFIKSGDYYSPQDTTKLGTPVKADAALPNGGCVRHVEVDQTSGQIIVELKDVDGGSCSYHGTFPYQCTAGNPVICTLASSDGKFQGVVTDETSSFLAPKVGAIPYGYLTYFNYDMESIQLIPDGNFVVTDDGFYDGCFYSSQSTDCANDSGPLETPDHAMYGLIRHDSLGVTTAKFYPVSKFQPLHAQKK